TKMPVWPVARKSAARPRPRISVSSASVVYILPVEQSVPTVSSRRPARFAPLPTGVAGGVRASNRWRPLRRAASTISGCETSRSCRPEATFMPASSAAMMSATESAPSRPPALATPTIMVLAPAARAWAKSMSGTCTLVLHSGPRNWPTHHSGRNCTSPRAVLAARSSAALPRYSRNGGGQRDASVAAVDEAETVAGMAWCVLCGPAGQGEFHLRSWAYVPPLKRCRPRITRGYGIAGPHRPGELEWTARQDHSHAMTEQPPASPSSTEEFKQAALDYHRVSPHGKIKVVPTKALVTQRELALAYSPGVAYACEAIVAEPDEASTLTARGNLVAVITNGTAVLGLGDIGPLASKPVMEGKGVLFQKFAGIDVFDIEVDERDPDRRVDIIASLEPTFGGINLEDIKAPECFIVERKLRERLKIPVFHDDQHGTAIIVGAALINALEIAGKRIDEVKIAHSGAGAAGIACLDMLVA